MTKIFSGIGQAIGALFNVEPKSLDEKLENEINEVLAQEREKIKPSRYDSNTFGWITCDNNPIHYIVERAKAAGFKDTPIRGAHIAAYAEQYIEGVVRKIKEYWGANIKIVGQKNKFLEPLYPEERVLWKTKNFSRKDGLIILSVEGSTKENKIVEVSSILGAKDIKFPEIAGPIYSRKYLIDSSHLDAFYKVVGGKVESKVANMFAAAFVPSTLLRLLEDKTETIEGINRKMEFDFIREAKPGRIQVDIFPPRKPKAVYRMIKKIDPETGKPIFDEKIGQIYEAAKDERGEKIIDSYAFEFRAIVSQDSKPITYGEVRSTIPPQIAEKLVSSLI